MVDEIKSFVFFDLEGTGLTDNPRITEISLMAIHRLAIDDAAFAVAGTSEDRNQYLPRVINKLTVCMYPMKVISKEAAAMTGLYNDSLLSQKDFDPDLVSLMSSFLCRLEPPVCLVSHNGFRFDFPLLKAELRSIGCDLPEGILCLDTWEMFRSLDGCPVPDTSHFLMPSRKTAIQFKKTHAASSLPLGSAKKKKTAQAQSQTGTEEEMIPCVRQLFLEVETQTNEFDAVHSQTVPQTKISCSLSVNSETIRVLESIAGFPVTEVVHALGNTLRAENTTSVAKSQTCELVSTENCSSVFVVESVGNERLSLNEVTALDATSSEFTDHLASDGTGTGRAVSDRLLQSEISCSVSREEETSAVNISINPALHVSFSDRDENKESSVFKPSIASDLREACNFTDKSEVNVKSKLDNTTRTPPCYVDFSKSVAVFELPSLAEKSDVEDCISKSISESLKEIDKKCDTAKKEIASEELSLNIMPPCNMHVIAGVESSFSSITSENFTKTTMGTQNQETDVMIKEYLSGRRNNCSLKRLSYRLAEIHLRVVGCYPSGSHRAEDDCIALARIFMFTPNSTQWADSHAVPFTAFRPLYCSPRKHLQPGVFPSHLH